jgi:hypothetical protein
MSAFGAAEKNGRAGDLQKELEVLFSAWRVFAEAEFDTFAWSRMGELHEDRAGSKLIQSPTLRH